MNINKTIFPGMTCMTVGEVKTWGKVLKDDGCNSEEILDFIQGIDDCLNIQKKASIINRFVGKAKWNRKVAKDLIYERAIKIPIEIKNQ